MPFYVLIEIDKEEDAKELTQQVLEAGSLLVGFGKSFCENGFDVPAKLKGVWRKPSIFCDPSDGHRAGRKTWMGWARSRKYGWWVCTGCGKPTKKWASGAQWAHTLGTSLVPQEITGEERPKGWEKSPVEWDFLLGKEGE